MSRWKTSIVVLAVGGLLSGCMPSQQTLRNESDLTTMKERLARVEQAAASQQSSDVKARIDALSRQQADLQASIDALRVDLQSINGRLSDMDSQRTQLRNDVNLMQNDLGLKVSALETRLRQLEGAAAAQSPAPAAGPAASTPAPAEATKAPQAAPPQSAAHSKTSKAAEALYRKGLDLVQKKKDYARGIKVLQDFLKRYPGDPLAVNAMYWIGEAYYGQKKYESAILEFQDVIQKYGDHPKVAAALLKQAMAFHELGDDKNSVAILKKLVATFPLSGEAGKAKQMLNEWRKASPGKHK